MNRAVSQARLIADAERGAFIQVSWAMTRLSKMLVTAAICCTVHANAALPPASSPRTNSAAPAQGPEERAIAFLSREVPRWSAENKCYSCHNNGDAARALYRAAALGYAVPKKSLADTTAWLARPHTWDAAPGDPGFSDKRLARIQFAAALAEGVGSAEAIDRRALAQAAEMVARDQQSDGSWPVDAAGSIGSPATYGAVLATHLASRMLRQADELRHRTAIAKADHWLLEVTPRSVLDASSLLLARRKLDTNPLDTSPKSNEQLAHAWELLCRGQSRDGGWGPYVTAPPEAFDTALALLALSERMPRPDAKKMVQRGRAYLLGTQSSDGGWPATTRPSGGESYAQRTSTTAWATMALIATQRYLDIDKQHGCRNIDVPVPLSVHIRRKT